MIEQQLATVFSYGMEFSFNQVFWYSKEQLERKLLYAINSEAGFDLSW